MDGLYYDQKTGILTAAPPNVYRCGWNLAGICYDKVYTCGFNLTLIGAWAAPEQTLRTFDFIKCIITPVTYSGSPRCLWQTHECFGSGLCCWKHYKIFKHGRSQSQKGGISVSGTLEYFFANQWCWWKAKACLLRSQPTRCQQPQMGTLKSKNLGSTNFFHPFSYDVENSLNSTVTLCFKSDQNNSYRRKTGPRAYLGIRIALECTITPVTYNVSHDLGGK